MRLEYCIIFLGSLTGVESWSIRSQNCWSLRQSLVSRIRTGDDKNVMEVEESIHCILNRLWYPGVEIDHFSNYIFHTVVYGQIDSYGGDDDSRSLAVRAMLFRGLIARFFHSQQTDLFNEERNIV
ncbi:hypothetical protein TNCV_1764371 [Trichonephila clavipes]|nr:hypothetical protein TNCV_1764371 [Trichonephila clavipes]